jgi:hypothetical protein
VKYFKKNPLRVNNRKYYRWQLPLIPAAALNTHKVQGLTCPNGIIYQPSENLPFARGLEYVAISRCTSISNNKLILLAPLMQKHFIGRPEFKKEYDMIFEAYEYFRQKYCN